MNRGFFGVSLRLALALGMSLLSPLGAAAAATAASSPDAIVATVNGALITQADVAIEIDALNVATGNADYGVVQDALKYLVARKLMVAALGNMPTPDETVSAEERRAQELALAHNYATQLSAAVPAPTDAQIAGFIADHPNLFAGRQMLQLDQIRLRASQANADKLKILEPDHTLAAVEDHLRGLGLIFDRTDAMLDTAQLPPEMVKEIDVLPKGEPFLLPIGGIVIISVVTGRTAVAADPAQTRQTAIDAWRAERATKVIADRVESLRRRAKIVYAAGFAPPAR